MGKDHGFQGHRTYRTPHQLPFDQLHHDLRTAHDVNLNDQRNWHSYLSALWFSRWLRRIERFEIKDSIERKVRYYWRNGSSFRTYSYYHDWGLRWLIRSKGMRGIQNSSKLLSIFYAWFKFTTFNYFKELKWQGQIAESEGKSLQAGILWRCFHCWRLQRKEGFWGEDRNQGENDKEQLGFLVLRAWKSGN